jgi:hypothetical protein
VIYDIILMTQEEGLKQQCFIVTLKCFSHTAKKTIPFCYSFISFPSVSVKSLVVDKWNTSSDIYKHRFKRKGDLMV